MILSTAALSFVDNPYFLQFQQEYALSRRIQYTRIRGTGCPRFCILNRLEGYRPMPRETKREKLQAFLMRRKINALGLLVLTIASAVVTVLCAVKRFARTDLLILISALLVGLCFVQAFKLRKSFRTIRSSKGLRRKRTRPNEEKNNGQ